MEGQRQCRYHGKLFSQISYRSERVGICSVLEYISVLVTGNSERENVSAYEESMSSDDGADDCGNPLHNACTTGDQANRFGS